MHKLLDFATAWKYNLCCMIHYGRVQRLFNQSVPADAIPKEAWNRLEELKRKLDPTNQAPDALDFLSEKGLLTAVNSLVQLWEIQWKQEAPQQAKIIQRYEEMLVELFRASEVTEHNIDEVGDRAGAIIESEEPGLEMGYLWATWAKELFVARRMTHFLQENGRPVPSDILEFIAQTETILHWGKERE